MHSEDWRPVVGYEGLYEVSSKGRVRSLDRLDALGRKWPSRIMKQFPSGRGDYSTVGLCRDGVRATHYVHRIAAEAFLGPAPGGTVCCHSNGNGRDNRLENLRWDTPVANEADKVAHGTTGRKSHCIRGHEKTPENTYAWTNPKTGYVHRYCRPCTAIRQSVA